MALKHLVLLLPGMDGTGQLFAEFLTTLPPTLTATVVSYPTKKFLSYSDLLQLVSAAWSPNTNRSWCWQNPFQHPLH